MLLRVLITAIAFTCILRAGVYLLERKRDGVSLLWTTIGAFLLAFANSL
jgi:hypothetical protein